MATNTIIRFFAKIDLILGLVLLTPKLGAWTLLFLHQLISIDILVINDYHIALMQLLGIMVVLWATVRIRETAVWQITYDCMARVVVLAYLGFHYYNGLTVLLFFILVELLGFYQLFYRTKKN